VLADVYARQGRARDSEAEARRGKALEARPRPVRRPGQPDPTD
jgi:hypothetical protein